MTLLRPSHACSPEAMAKLPLWEAGEGGDADGAPSCRFATPTSAREDSRAPSVHGLEFFSYVARVETRLMSSW